MSSPGALSLLPEEKALPQCGATQPMNVAVLSGLIKRRAGISAKPAFGLPSGPEAASWRVPA
jgi:hypothetical protein